MSRRKKEIPKYGQITLNGQQYYRTRIKDADRQRVALYAKTPEELYEKVQEAQQLIKEAKFRKENPTVEEYATQWLELHSQHIKSTTMVNYKYIVKNCIIKHLGHMYVADVTPDDVKKAMLMVSEKSQSVYHNAHTMYLKIFQSAVDNGIIDKSPCANLSSKGGKPQKKIKSLTNEQVDKLLEAIDGLPPYTFVMLGLYAGLRREESLALQWDCVFLDVPTPYISVRRAWHIEHNRPVILDELKTDAAPRDIPIPQNLIDCLRKEKANSNSDFVISNRDGGPLSGTQFDRVWKYIKTRTAGERVYYRYVNGVRTKFTIDAKLGEKAKHNNKVVYSLDFHVTTHQLRHTYITNLIHASVDPKTVQYLAGHKNSKITMDIYAEVKYNQPEQLSSIVNEAFNKLNGSNLGLI